ncbi:MAG: hypothetical protein ACPGES_11135 [Coraliomargarita sp.]
MNLIVKLLLVGLSCYTVGTLVGPIAVGTVQESRETLSPFMFISAAVLIASIGYAVGAIRRSPFSGSRDPREEGYYR